MPIKNHQKKLDAHFRKLGWTYWPPLVILARLTEEVGEFARLVNHRFGMKKKKPTEAEQDMEEELGDILYTLACFANQNNIDLDKAFKKSFDKVVIRDKHRFDKQK